MKKERSAFFQNSASSYYYPNNMMMPNVPMTTQSNSEYYEGPVMGMMPNMDNNYNNEIETKLAKIERQINRLDSRVTKLESETLTNKDLDINSNMYML